MVDNKLDEIPLQVPPRWSVPHLCASVFPLPLNLSHKNNNIKLSCPLLILIWNFFNVFAVEKWSKGLLWQVLVDNKLDEIPLQAPPRWSVRRLCASVFPLPLNLSHKNNNISDDARIILIPYDCYLFPVESTKENCFVKPLLLLFFNYVVSSPSFFRGANGIIWPSRFVIIHTYF